MSIVFFSFFLRNWKFSGENMDTQHGTILPVSILDLKVIFRYIKMIRFIKTLFQGLLKAFDLSV